MKRMKAIIFLLSCILVFNVANIVTSASTSSNGCNYRLIGELPYSSSYTYYKTSSTPNIDEAIESAMNTWEIASVRTNSKGKQKIWFTLGSGTKSFNNKDNINTIGSVISTTAIMNMGGTSTAIAYNSLYTNGSKNIYYSDIAFSASYSFGNGVSTQYYDYQGVLTHELGHTLGLDDLYESSSELYAETINDLPTMYGSAKYKNSGMNVSILLRTVTQGDIDGLAEVIKKCGF